MRVFDIGFYDGKDLSYYLDRGFEVVAFEANPILCESGRRLFVEAIATGQLQLYNLGIGVESGDQVDFFIHNESEEWSTFFLQAAMNWGKGKSRVMQVPCITPKDMFARFGCPHYLKADIEGYDIIIADELQDLTIKPSLVSFEASHIRLLRSLLLAGYQSFKMADQARVPLQVVRDRTTEKEFGFRGGTGPFGDDAEGEWLSFENASYLFYRFAQDPFSSSTPEGHWFDFHASLKAPVLNEFQQRDYLRHLIEDAYSGHCGMEASLSTPKCPAAQAIHPDRQCDEVELLRQQLNTIQTSRAWKLVSSYRGIVSTVRNLFGRIHHS